ncbi:MAG: multicopper oxidase domain-containing protein [Pleurocapsa sp. SU_5_0]|nr:multicopper oxidase domain-containing protein [Pleurocapsa sp. SU_5_0]NJO95807.1 multicopper oxidase domain-containing protein [Pleurocapsa sp. CRU_1_2]
MPKTNRRQFMILAAAGAIATSATSWAIGKNNKTSLQTKALPSKLHKSSNGLLELDLEANSTRIDLAGKPADLLTYNGQVPAPRLEAKAGDTVRIRFTNNLSQPTNLHYHGLHVTPNGNADNAFIDILPKENLTYEFTIPTKTRSIVS